MEREIRESSSSADGDRGMRQERFATTGLRVQQIYVFAAVLTYDRAEEQSVSVGRPNNIPEQGLFEKEHRGRSFGQNDPSRFVSLDCHDAIWRAVTVRMLRGLV